MIAIIIPVALVVIWVIASNYWDKKAKEEQAKAEKELIDYLLDLDEHEKKIS